MVEFLRLLTYETMVLPASETRIIHGVVTFMEGVVEVMMKKTGKDRYTSFRECAQAYDVTVDSGDLNITEFLRSFAKAQNMNMDQVSDCYIRHAQLMHDFHFLIFFKKWLHEDCKSGSALEQIDEKTR